MNKPLVSVIVPVYKVEKYIRECVDSIINQTYKNLEIILVDDGSPDNCGKICDEYAKADNRVKVIHKENGGLSDARNAGLDVALGEYISFVDSDDYISPFFIETMIKCILNNGVSIAALKDAVRFYDDEVEPLFEANTQTYAEKIYSASDALKLMFYQKICTGAQFKVYSSSIWDELRFPKGYLYEDVATTYKTFMKANSVAVVEVDIYAYRLREDSIVRSKFSESKMICLKIADEVQNAILDYDNSLYQAATTRVFSLIYSVYLQVPYNETGHRKLLWSWIKKYRRTVLLNKDKIMRKKAKLGALTSYSGMRLSYLIGRKFGQKGTFYK